MQKILVTFLAFIFSPTVVSAAGSSATAGAENKYHLAFLFLAIAGILVSAKILHLIEKIKFPPVVGELLAGIILGNVSLIGFSFFKEFRTDEIIAFLAEFGVILLLFQIGLESNIGQLVKVGGTALFVAIIGAVVPFILGTYVAGPLLLPGQSIEAYLFLGASLAATSVGITARIFKDMGKMKTKAAQIVLGAAVIDDILGLILLAVISGLAIGGSVTPVSVGLIVLKSFLFLFLSIVIGQLIAPHLSRLFSLINTGIGSKFTLAISFGLFFAAIAQLIGLEPIIGAFAAGLVLDPVHFKRYREPHVVEELKTKMTDLSAKSKAKMLAILNHHAERSIEDIIEPLALFFVPIFFVVTGMQVIITDLLQPSTILIAAIITIIAIGGKLVSGFPVKGKSRWTVGLAMVPRGEVGLIFASIGQALGVISSQVFSVIVLTVLLTTVIGPFLLTKNLQSEE